MVRSGLRRARPAPRDRPRADADPPRGVAHGAPVRGGTDQAAAITRHLRPRSVYPSWRINRSMEDRMEQRNERDSDLEALRRAYRELKEAGRAAEAHDALNRLVELDPTGGTAAFAHRERAKLGETGARPVRIAILSSYVLDPLVPFLDVECRRAGLSPAFYVAPFNQYTQDVLNPASGLYAFGPDIVFVALDAEDLFPAIRRVPGVDELSSSRAEIRANMAGLVRELRARSTALIVGH